MQRSRNSFIKPVIRQIPRINWSHPLARGLLFDGFDLGNGTAIDLVSGRFASGGGLKRNTSRYGVTAQFDGSTGTGFTWTIGSGPQGLAITQAGANNIFSFATRHIYSGPMGNFLAWAGINNANNSSNVMVLNWDRSFLYRSFIFTQSSGGTDLGGINVGAFSVQSALTKLVTVNGGATTTNCYGWTDTGYFTQDAVNNASDPKGGGGFGPLSSDTIFMGASNWTGYGLDYMRLWGRALTVDEGWNLSYDPFGHLIFDSQFWPGFDALGWTPPAQSGSTPTTMVWNAGTAIRQNVEIIGI